MHKYFLLALIVLASPATLFAQTEYGLVSETQFVGPAIRAKAGSQTNIVTPVSSSPIGVVATGQNRGVFGASDTGAGMYARSKTNYGLWGQSTTYRGVTGRTSRADNNYGLYTPDNFFASNVQTSGALLQVMQNTGAQALSAGDVVSLNGIDRSLQVNDGPIIQVSKTETANSTAVAGVVFSTFDINSIDERYDNPDFRAAKTNQNVVLAPRPTPPDSAAPGDYVLVVVLGPAKVKTSPQAVQSIRAGDLLSTSDTSGQAQKAPQINAGGTSFTAPGTVFAKALETRLDQDSMMYVYVSPR